MWWTLIKLWRQPGFMSDRLHKYQAMQDNVYV